MTHLSGKDFSVMAGDLLVHVESMSASITDNSGVAMSGGVPDGTVSGDVSCSGEIELDSKNFALVTEAARSAGSFQELEPFDIICNGKKLDVKQKIELFGCQIKVSDLLSLDQKGGEKTKHKLPFDVSSPDFVRIDGVPYLSADSTANL